MKKKSVILLLLSAIIAISCMCACSKSGSTTNSSQETSSTSAVAMVESTTTPETTSEVTTEPPTEPATEPPTEPATEPPTEPATEPPTEPATEPPTEPVTEPPTEPYVGPWTLLTQEPLNPTASGYEELDNLVNALIAKVVTPDMNNYQKVWACYEYIIDNVSYSRGMDAHTGEYSSSDPAVTPTEVLWATDLLNTMQGCCYNYSSTFVYIMRALGYDAHLISGNVPEYGGGETPHCWLYVNLAGAQYTFDPDLDMNFYTRELKNGVENPAKDRFFCAPISTYSYFYKPVTYHNN